MSSRCSAPSSARRQQGLEALVALGGCYGFDYALHNQYCALIFQCGCTWPWAGGSSHCNIHNTVGGPKCPWCMASPETVFWTRDTTTVALMFLGYAVTAYLHQRQATLNGEKALFHLLPDSASSPTLDPSLAVRRSRCCANKWWAVAVPILVFVVFDFLTGLAFFLGTDYPYFFLRWR
jgi:hypothetical protein